MMERARRGAKPSGGRPAGRRFSYLTPVFVALSWMGVVWFACALPVHAQDGSMWADSATQSVPKDAKVTLHLDRPECFLGENVLVHFVLQNTGDAPFDAAWGGDYRGASRHLRFQVTATDESGQPAEDPDPFPMCMGGLGGTQTLKPGEKVTWSLPLMRYCDILKPGVYTIRATHDFGWKEADRKRPVGEARITFLLPDAQQAEQVVDAMAALPASPNASWGKRSVPYADFRCLRHPVYLDALTRRARGGDVRVLEGIGLIPTAAANRALIELAGSADQAIAIGAAHKLNARLPYPDSHRVPAAPGSSEEPRLSIRGRLVARGWDEALAPDVRELAARLLKDEALSTVAAAAFMLTCVGTKEDAPVVLDAINRARNPTFRNRTEPKDNILDLPPPLRELLRAMDTLRARGYASGEQLGGDAEILYYFHRLRDDPKPRPGRYGKLLDAFGTSSWFPIREAAVRSLPKPMPPDYRDFVLERLEDKDLGVCRAACTVAGASKDTAFLQPLLDIIATEQHEWLLREAGNAARELVPNTHLPLLEAWADRLADKTVYPLALDGLQSVLVVPSGSYSGRTDLPRAERLQLREAWKAFLVQNADAIRAGKRFEVSDPAVTPDLVGRARSWRLPDGTQWPALRETGPSE